MESTKSKVRKELAELVQMGIDLLYKEQNSVIAEIANSDKVKKENEKDETKYDLRIDYQTWYTKSVVVIARLAPERLKDFQEYYKLPSRKEVDFLTYTISDYLIGLRIGSGSIQKIGTKEAFNAFSTKFHNQIGILASVLKLLDNILANITGVLQADLFDSELEAAEELLKNGHIRSAGVLAGVTLEGHLDTVCNNHSIKITKKDPSINDYNAALKDVLELSQWRFIQHLGDLRNKCAHKQSDEPTKDDAKDLIEGVKKIIKTVF